MKAFPFKLILIIFILCMLLIIYIFRRSNLSICGKTPDYTVTATQLSFDYSNNEMAANKIYLEKIICVEGVVYERDEKYVLLGNTSLFINCDFEQGQLYPDIKPGDNIKIIGVCSGLSLMDVCLKNCCVSK